MLVFRDQGARFKSRGIRAWWPQSLREVIPLLEEAPVVMLRQCPAAMVPDLRRWVFQRRSFQTPLIDLRRNEEELWKGLDAKSCRYEVRKAQKMGCVISRNEDCEAARLLINDSIRRLRYRAELDGEEWQALLPGHDIFLCRWHERPLVAHVLLRDHPGRIRLLLSGGVDRGDERFRSAVGPANRFLHWRELEYDKGEGFHLYDFGGCDLDQQSPHYRNSQFKLSFGGKVVDEPTVYLAKNPALRCFYRGMGAIRVGLRLIPWPQACMKVFRTRPKLLPWLR